MEKLFWGMIGGCTAAFAILLGMYLNKAGVIGAEPETSTEIVSEIETSTEMEEELLAEDGEFPSDIQSMIEDSQRNYSQAMQVFEDESSAVASREEEARQTTSGTTVSTGTTGSGTKTNGSVDGNRNDNHDYFLESPSEEESEIEESSTEAEKPEEKKNSEYEYT
ncbi:MAG: hypothetical protein K2K74_10440, partial [Lachnospiraceae bacterium]|nr:hypothetical protein [Lachnospiraceae bacterium]